MLIFVAMLMVVFMVITAIVVDLGNVRQQKRQAVGGADAGALAGAQSLTAAAQVPAACPDASCTAAYYTLASVSSAPSSVAGLASGRGPCTLETVSAGETCWQYQSGKATFSDWIAAQRTQREVEAEAQEHLARYQMALAELEAVVGADLKIFPTTPGNK